LTQFVLTVRQIAALKKGDVLPIEMPEEVVVNAEGMPVFRGQLGKSGEKYAVKVLEWMSYGHRQSLQEYLKELDEEYEEAHKHKPKALPRS
jgi:flagellar motor switch protein FliM